MSEQEPSRSSSLWQGLRSSLGIAPVAAAQKFPAVEQPGVTDKEIRVGGVANVTQNPTGVSYAGVRRIGYSRTSTRPRGSLRPQAGAGVQRDDQLTNNRQEVEGLLSDDNVFAALPMATNLFTGAQLLKDAGIPVFELEHPGGMGLGEQRARPVTLFAIDGAYRCFTLPRSRGYTQFLAKSFGLKKVGVLAYNVPQSASCAEGINKSFKKFPTAKVAFDDESLVFETPDYSAQVAPK